MEYSHVSIVVRKMDEMIKQYLFKEIGSCNMCGSMDFSILGLRLNQSQGRSPKSKKGIAVSVSRCDTCGLIFSNPQPIPNSINDHYDMDPNSYWSSEYFEVSPDFFGTEIAAMKGILPYQENQKVLDIGVGIGKTLTALKSAGYQVSGIEPSRSFYQMAIDRMGISPSELKCASIEESEFQEEEFDIITFGAVLEHLYDPSDALSRAMKWLKPGGIIHAEIPHSRWLVSKLLNLYYFLRGTNFVTHLSPMHQPFHLYEFSEKSFVMNGKIHGYMVEKIDFYCGYLGLPVVIEKTLNLFMKIFNRELVMTVYLKKK